MVRIFSARLNETSIYEIKSKRLRLPILTYLIFLVLFPENSHFHWRRQPFRKNAIVEEGLDGIDINEIGNLEDSPRLVFIGEEYQNLIVINECWRTYNKY